MKRIIVFLLCFVAVLTTVYAQTHFMGDFETIGVENGYEWVDLGLPSGLKWATCNVGATKPEEIGLSFAWGETTQPETYKSSWNAYKWATAIRDSKSEYERWNLEKLTKYNTNSDYGTVDNKTILDPEDDAATVNMGGKWRMPTYEEFLELRNLCRWKRTKKGYKVIGPNGNSIFLTTDYSYGGNAYWTRSLDLSDSSKAKGFFFVSNGWVYKKYCKYRKTYQEKHGYEEEDGVIFSQKPQERFVHFSVRGVCE